METKIIDGKKIAQEIIDGLKEKVQHFEKKPTLAVVIVGSNPASKVYVKNKGKKALEVGFNSITKELREDTTKEDLLNEIEKLNSNPDITGILLQLPLPSHLDARDFLDKIDPIKDVDGFNTYNAGKLFKFETPYAIPCTPKGIMTILNHENINPEGKIITVIGRSNIVGKPISSLLLSKNATVIQAHSKTRNLKELTLMSDIIISATGKCGILTGDMIKEGAVIIDVGIIRDENGKLKGDVDATSVLNKASYLTPVPGGVGPLTIASLMENTYELFLLQNRK